MIIKIVNNYGKWKHALLNIEIIILLKLRTFNCILIRERKDKMEILFRSSVKVD